MTEAIAVNPKDPRAELALPSLEVAADFAEEGVEDTLEGEAENDDTAEEPQEEDTAEEDAGDTSQEAS